MLRLDSQVEQGNAQSLCRPFEPKWSLLLICEAWSSEIISCRWNNVFDLEKNNAPSVSRDDHGVLHPLQSSKNMIDTWDEGLSASEDRLHATTTTYSLGLRLST